MPVGIVSGQPVLYEENWFLADEAIRLHDLLCFLLAFLLLGSVDVILRFLEAATFLFLIRLSHLFDALLHIELKIALLEHFGKQQSALQQTEMCTEEDG